MAVERGRKEDAMAEQRQWPLAGKPEKIEPTELTEKPAQPVETIGDVIHLDRRQIPGIVARIREQEDELEREERAM